MGLLYRLEYRLETDGWEIAFENPPPKLWKPGPFDLELNNGAASVEMNDRFPEAHAARRAVECYLRAWELKTILGIRSKAAKFSFQFVKAVVSSRETSKWRPPTAVLVSQVAVEALV